MAIRALLHMNKLKDFESWLEKQGYMILPTSKNPYEILRAKKDKDTVIIYKKGGSEEHLSIMNKDYPLICKFIRESKSETNANRIRNMSDEELAEFLITFKNTFGKEYEGEASCMEWLQSEAKETATNMENLDVRR